MAIVGAYGSQLILASRRRWDIVATHKANKAREAQRKADQIKNQVTNQVNTSTQTQVQTKQSPVNNTAVQNPTPQASENKTEAYSPPQSPIVPVNETAPQAIVPMSTDIIHVPNKYGDVHFPTSDEGWRSPDANIIARDRNDLMDYIARGIYPKYIQNKGNKAQKEIPYINGIPKLGGRPPKPWRLISIMDTRKNFVFCIIGTNGTGKTTVEKEIISIWRASRPTGKVIAFDEFDQLAGLVDFKILRTKDWALHVNEKVRNSLIVLDDYKNLIEGYTPSIGMRELFVNRRLNNNDYIYSCHSPIQVLPQLVPYTTHFYIFYTKATIGTFSDRLDHSNSLIAASSYVNKYVDINGYGLHPLDPDFRSAKNKGQMFPYLYSKY